MDFQPNFYTIDKLLRWIDTGRMALPEFQRDFVWTPARAMELLDSVAKGWPVGTLLLLEGPQAFRAKSFEGAPVLRGEKIGTYVLDGQQRLTALYHAVTDASDVVYYVDFPGLLDDAEEYIKWERRDRFTRRLPDVRARAEAGIAKICEVYDGAAFQVWLRHTREPFGQHAAALREHALPGLRSQVYKIVVIELEQDIELAALARIFETINRTGMKLNAFDLMVAVLYPEEFNLRDEWDVAQIERPILAQFEVDGVEVLKLIALWERRRQQESGQRLTVTGVRQSDVLAIPPAAVKAEWVRALDGYASALEWLSSNAGLRRSSSVPAPAMILTLAYFLSERVQDPVLHKWYWTAIATQVYAQGANTQVTSDVDRLGADGREARGWSTGLHDSLIASLTEPARRARLLLRGIGGLLTRMGAPDPVTGRPLTQAEDVVMRPATRFVESGQDRGLGSAAASMMFIDKASVPIALRRLRAGHPFDDVFRRDLLSVQGFPTFSLRQEAESELVAFRAKSLADLLQDAAHGAYQ